MTFKIAVVLGAVYVLGTVRPADELHTFKRVQLSDQFWSEGANAGDLNNDGVKDIISGPYWWAGPGLPEAPRVLSGSDDLPVEARADDDRDGARLRRRARQREQVFRQLLRLDLRLQPRRLERHPRSSAFPGTDTSWFENPKGSRAALDRGTRSSTRPTTNRRRSPTSPATASPSSSASPRAHYGYAEPDWTDPAKPWTFHAISPDKKYGNFTHGLGVGDVNGDGRADLIEKDGWWEQPASLGGDPLWTFHPQPFGTGGAQMYAYDVNGDRLADVITALPRTASGWRGSSRCARRVRSNSAST